MKNIIILLLLITFSGTLSAQNPLTNLFNSPATIQTDTTVNGDKTIKKSISIQNVNEIIQDTETMLLKAREKGNRYNWVRIDSLFTAKEKFISKELKEFNSYDKANLSKFFLKNLRLSWSNYVSDIEKWQNELNIHLEKIISEEEVFIERKTVLKKNYQFIVKENLPVLKSRILKTIKELDAVINNYENDKKQLLILQTRLSNKNVLCHRVIDEIQDLNAQLRGELLMKTKPAIWHIKLKNTIKGGFVSSFKRAYINNYKSTSYYYHNLKSGLASYIFLIILISVLVILIRKKYIALGYDNSTPGHAVVERVLLKNPVIIIISLGLIIWILYFPYIPILLSDIFFMSILILLSVILRSFIDKPGKKLLYILATLLILNVLEIVIWYMGDYSRLYLLMETTAGLVVLFPYISIYKNHKISEKSRFAKMAKKFLPFVLFTYSVAFLGNIFGYLNLSVLFIKIGIRTAAITMIAFGYKRVIENIFFAAISLLDKKYPHIVIKYGDIINKRASKVISVIVFFIWAEIILRIFEIDVVSRDWLSSILTTDANIGTISISLSDIILFSGILYITFILSTFIKTIIEKEILRKMKLPRGFPAAISMILRIFLVTIGIMIALSATGIELSKLGLLAGALGVGIGFGLQNIVQNFISGLILIFERPIQVGDTVEVNNLLGRVRDIGVRASNVITYDGAEVIVPNSNLISNDLINWTLSDSRKRVEIKVGVAYGSDPNLVLKLIERVALDHPDVEKNPPPTPLFEGFGDSSLDFRLLFWVNFEFGLKTKSDVAIGIYNIFAEHGIEIPFPQVDLHVKDIADKKLPANGNNELTE